MFIADSQVHIWAAETPERPWRTGARNQPHRAQPFSKDDLLREMNAAGVSRVVLVPPSMEGDRNDLVVEAARQHPDRFAAMGRIALNKPESETLVSTARQQGLTGLRVTFYSGGQPLVAGGKADWLWPAAERAGVPLMASVTTELFPDFKKVAGKHPGLKLAIDHVGVVRGRKDDEAFANQLQVMELAKWPNISIKMSAMPCFSTESYPYAGLHRHIKRVYDAFGPERMFWGTDFTRLPCTYRQAITLFTEELPWLTTSDKEWIMGKALCRWLDWPLPES